jgi:Zn-dependent protease with chaperone function
MMLYFENITYAMLHNILFLGLLWLLLQLVNSIFNFKANTQFKIGTTLQFVATILFLLDVTQLYRFPIQYLKGINISIPNPHSYFAIIGIVYCFSLVYLIGQLIYRITELKALKKSIVIDPSLKELMKEIHQQIPQNLTIGYSNKVNSPVVFGFFEPVILLPFALCNQLTVNEIKLILLHELAHIIRNDYLLNFVQTIANIILWFNPFNHLLSKSLSLQREIACDELVLQSQQASPLLYTKILYQLSLLNKNSYNELRLAAVQHQGELLTRIYKINKVGKGNTFSFKPIVAILGLSLLFIIQIRPIHQYESQFTAQHSSIKDTPKKNAMVLAQNNNLKINNKATVQIKQVPRKIKQYEYTKLLEAKESINEDKLAYDELISQTKNWIKARQNPIQFASYDQQMDSVDDLIAERLLITSIVRSYQLKKAILTEKLQMAKDRNEASDFLYNSKEWAEIKEYEKWAKTYLERHQ